MNIHKSKLSAIAPVFLILTLFISPTYAWESLTVFGDSLSDGGNIGRYTNDGSQNLLYDDIIAHNLGDDLKPSGYRGRNYAQGGATATPGLNPALNTKDQIKNYLQSTGGHADSNGLYIHWVGANDIAAALMSPLQTGEIIQNSAVSAVEQVKTLFNAGAGVVVVPNVPQLGMTPYVVQILLSKLGASSLAAAFEVLNNSTVSDDASRQLALRKAFRAAAEQVSDVPEKRDAIAQQLYDSWLKLSSQVTGLTDSYNQQQESELGKLNGNIARIDIAGLFNEVAVNPNQYGLDNTIGIACPLGTSADKCHSSDPGFKKDLNYLFADRLHPTPAAHRLMADYIQSVLNAPAQAASLSTSADLMKRDMHSTLDGHLQQQRLQTGEAGKLLFFGGYAGGRVKTDPEEWPKGKSTTTNLTMGIGYQLTDSLQSGVIFSNSNQRMGLSSDYSYKLHGSLAGIYSQLSFLQGGWVNAELHYSTTDYDDIQRRIKIGPALRTEQGSSKGNQMGMRLQTGWNFFLNEHFLTGPVAGYSLDKTHVNGYSEIDNRSTSMRFSDQTFHSQIGSIGWRFESKRFQINPWAQVIYSHQFGDTQSGVRAGLKSTKTSFKRAVKAGNQDWVDVAVGVNIPLNKTLNAFAGITTTVSKHTNHPLNWNIGLNATF